MKIVPVICVMLCMHAALLHTADRQLAHNPTSTIVSIQPETSTLQQSLRHRQSCLQRTKKIAYMLAAFTSITTSAHYVGNFLGSMPCLRDQNHLACTPDTTTMNGLCFNVVASHCPDYITASQTYCSVQPNVRASDLLSSPITHNFTQQHPGASLCVVQKACPAACKNR